MDFCKGFLLIVAFILTAVYGIDIQSAYDLYNDLLSNYSADIRPVHNDSENQNVYFDVHLSNINRLDEVHGELIVVMGLTMYWQDVKLQWNPDDYEGRQKIEVDITKIWSPGLKLTTPSHAAVPLGKERDKAVVLHQGLVIASVIETIYASCSVNIAYFPFDTQTCDIWFTATGYGHLLKYIPNSPNITTDIYSENVVWALGKTEVKSISSGYNDNLVCTINLQRRATFTTLNLLIPIIILMLLNSMVFVLPAESGERVGFTVTLLLAITVYMTIISDQLPNSSKPTPILTYVLVAYLAQSAFICVETIIILSTYSRDEQKPFSSVVLNFFRVIKCCRLNRTTENFSKREGVSSNPDENLTDVQINRCEGPFEIQHGENTLTQVSITGTLDSFFLLLNVIISLVIAAVYLSLVLI